MDEILTVVAAVLIAIVTVVIGYADINRTVIDNCEARGWHNFGQTRIICSVEKK